MKAARYREQVPLVDLVASSPQSTTADHSMQIATPEGGVPGGKRQRSLSADQQELVDLMATLEMRKQDFAVQLGIGVSRLSSYVYGQTASVPDEVMARARQLFQERSLGLAEAKRRFAGDMATIVGEWRARLKTETNEQLANYLGVTTMTIHRWCTGAMRPDLTALVRYQQQVDHLVARLGRADAAVESVMSRKA